MATPAELDHLERQLESYGAGRSQICFLRAYAEGENITRFAYDTPPPRRGHVITGVTGSGREVRIVVDQTNVEQITIRTAQGNGRFEFIAIEDNTAVRQADGYGQLRIGLYRDAIMRPTTPEGREWPDTYGYAARMVGRRIHWEMAPDPSAVRDGRLRHQQLLGYTGCRFTSLENNHTFSA